MIQKVKRILKTNDNLLIIAASLYSIIQLNYTFRSSFAGVFLKKTKFNIKGKSNTIVCGKRSRVFNCLFHINGDNNAIHIGENCLLQNLELWIEDDNNTVRIGSRTTTEGGHIASTEGQIIEIGEDCMISSNLEIRNGDSHPILNAETGQRINFAAPIIIGNHVWLGKNVTILKKSTIAENCIIGTGSIVTGQLDDANCIYVGIPAKKVKSSIKWERQR